MEKEPACPSLQGIALFLNTANNHMDDRPANAADIEALTTDELDFVHQLITRHLISCPVCRFNESMLSLGPWSGSNVIPIDGVRVH
jgi:hypothetical protein